MDQEENIKSNKEYELAFLISDEHDASGLISALKSSGAEITLEGPVQKIALAYEIKKQTSANFGFVQFSMNPASAKSLESSLSLRPELLRFMIITPPSAKENPYSSHATPEEVSDSSSMASSKPAETKTATASGTLSNEDLEKKIEEILK